MAHDCDEYISTKNHFPMNLLWKVRPLGMGDLYHICFFLLVSLFINLVISLFVYLFIYFNFYHIIIIIIIIIIIFNFINLR